jgi:hypothetical protein
MYNLYWNFPGTRCTSDLNRKTCPARYRRGWLSDFYRTSKGCWPGQQDNFSCKSVKLQILSTLFLVDSGSLKLYWAYNSKSPALERFCRNFNPADRSTYVCTSSYMGKLHRLLSTKLQNPVWRKKFIELWRKNIIALSSGRFIVFYLNFNK